MPFKIICVAGARPNFMKIAPLIRELNQDPFFKIVLVHTGQHYDDKMSGQFFRELEIPDPDYNLQVGSGTHAQQTAAIMQRFEPVVLDGKPDAVLVAGDVNSTLACALVAKKLGVAVVHVEAGLRSFDRSMPEEINRLVTDSVSDLFLVTEESGRRNLLAEGVSADRIHLVGNLMIDTLRRNLERARQSAIISQLGLVGAFGLVTLHRPANVDDPGQFAAMFSALMEIAGEMPLCFPVHPRTRQALERCGLEIPATIRLLEPLGYLDFLCLMSHSAIVLTDSGGIQEETTALGIPCITLRENTERPATVEQGTNILAGTSREGILSAWKKVKNRKGERAIPPYWDGSAAQRCHDVLRLFAAELSPTVQAKEDNQNRG